MNIDTFAEKHQLRIRLDQCGDKIIPGKRGHLYIAGGELGLMVTDGTVANSSRWKELGARSLIAASAIDAGARIIRYD